MFCFGKKTLVSINIFLFQTNTPDFIRKPVSCEIQKLYKQQNEIYLNIKKLEDDPKLWFEALLETNDERFIVQNIENKLCTHYLEMFDLWKIYIDYLKTKDIEAAYEVYYRYRRMFLEDTSMDEEFKNFKYQIPQSQYLHRMKFQQPKPQSFISEELQHFQQRFPINSIPRNQKFPFHATFLNYIISKASEEMIQKFYKSCKYFYFQIQKPISHSLFIGVGSERFKMRNNKYSKQSLSLSRINNNEEEEKNNSIELLNNLWISNSMVIENNNFATDLCSKILPKFGACTLRYLTLINQAISISEYNYLTESGNIKKLGIIGGSITSDSNDENIDGDPILLEDLLKVLPNLYYFESNIEFGVTPTKTGMKINHLKFNKKFILFKIKFHNILIDAYEFAVFVYNNVQNPYEQLKFGYAGNNRIVLNEFWDNYVSHLNNFTEEDANNYDMNPPFFYPLT